MNKLIVLLLIILGVITRLIPHPPNFTPILSIALLSSLYFKNKFSIVLPLSIMFLSDIFIGGHLATPWVYSSIILIYLIGLKFIKNNSFKYILIYSFLSSIVFFIITNLGVWIIGYPLNTTGLITCFIAAIPFYKNTLFGVMFYFMDYIVWRIYRNIIICIKSIMLMCIILLV